jgi:endonuclease/exonuclease/phosphatase family metal-dependent hydrolase
MAENPDVKYAFSTGDYNSKPGAESYTILLTQTGLLNSMDVARTSGTLKNDVGGCAEVGKNKETVTTFGPIDHIMISKNVSVLVFETILWNKTEHLSDHSAKYADVYLN